MAESETRQKTAIADAKRFNGFYLDPWRVVIVGRDKTDVYGEKHPLYQERAKRGVNVPRCLNMIRHGFPGVALICPGAGNGAPVNPTGGGSKDEWLCVAGRGRTIDARHANTIVAEAIKLKQMEKYETPEQLAKLLEKVAGFEIPIAVARTLAGRGESAKTILVKTEIVRGEGSYLRARAGGENAESMRDPDDDLYEQGLAMRAFLDEGQGFGVDESDAAVEWGVTTETVQNRLKLLDCAPDVIAQAKAKAITWSEALQLAGLPDDVQAERLSVIPKKTPGQKRRSKKEGRRPGRRTAEKIVEHLGPGHDVALFWKFMSGAKDGLEAVLKIDKGLKAILAPEKKAKEPRAKKEKK